MALVSILMPVKNAELWLEECITSIQSQSLNDWELLAVDDHSSDSSLELLAQLSHSDSRIKISKNKGKGIISALQQAYENSRGDFFTRMDADDIMPIGKLKNLYELASSKGVIATGKVNYFSENNVSKGYLDYEKWLNDRVINKDHYHNIYRECVIASPNWMISRKDLERVLPFTSHNYPEDYDLVFRFYELGCPISSINKVTHLWREHPQRTSRISDYYSQNSFFSLKLNWFLKLEFNSSKKLILFGRNKKEQICRKFFANKNIPYQTIDIENYTSIESLNDMLILVCVYPKYRERKKIESYLNRISVSSSSKWWYV